MWVVDGPSDSRALERKIGGWNLYRKGKKDVLPETWLILSSFPWPFWKHSTPFCPQVLNPRIQVLNSISTNKVFVLNGSQSFHVNNLFYICWTSILHNYLFRHNINVCVVFGLLTTINFFHNKLEILRIFSQKYMITRSLSALLENFIKIFLYFLYRDRRRRNFNSFLQKPFKYTIQYKLYHWTILFYTNTLKTLWLVSKLAYRIWDIWPILREQTRDSTSSIFFSWKWNLEMLWALQQPQWEPQRWQYRASRISKC